MTDNMHEIALTRALKTLDAIGARYAVIFEEQTYGTLALAPPPKMRKDGRPRYKRGTTRAHYLPYIENLQIGQTAAIPFADFDVKILISNVTAACTHLWGNQSYISRRNNDAGTINILRLI